MFSAVEHREFSDSDRTPPMRAAGKHDGESFRWLPTPRTANTTLIVYVCALFVKFQAVAVEASVRIASYKVEFIAFAL